MTDGSKAKWRDRMVKERRWTAFQHHRRLYWPLGLSRTEAHEQAVRDFNATEGIPPPPAGVAGQKGQLPPGPSAPRPPLPPAPFIPAKPPMSPAAIEAPVDGTAAKPALPKGLYLIGPEDVCPFRPEDYPDTVDRRGEMDWVFTRLAVDTVDPATAPSAGAVGYWQECKKYPKSRSAFYTAVYQRLLPSQSLIDSLERFEDDGSKIDDAIDQLERELINQALEASAEGAVEEPEVASDVVGEGSG